MRFAVTGADGFLGWHTRCAIRARGDECVSIGRQAMSSAELLAQNLNGVDAVLHLAGVNRGDARAVRDENAWLAHRLTDAIDLARSRPAIVYANSIQSGNGSPFGDGKQAAADHLAQWSASSGTPVVDVRVPNVFGEHGRPHYNSVVATFCDELAHGGRPSIIEDREIPLLHAQDAADTLLDLARQAEGGVVRPAGRLTKVSALLELLTEFAALYRSGDIPDLTDPLHLALFNTYRSFSFPEQFPLRVPIREDRRGHLFECVRGHGGQSHVFCSTTHPGITRGEHFHRRKVERFLVLDGLAEIALRRLFDDHVITFRVAGAEPAIVDMPTMWAHSITNIGDSDLLTLFWAHEILDPGRPDTHPEKVHTPARAETSRA